jgi:hypothetical protein
VTYFLQAIPAYTSLLTDGEAESSRDQCYDFKNIFAKKFSEKIGVFESKQSYIMPNFDPNVSS